MSQEDIVAIGAAVTAVTQIIKRSLPGDGQGPAIVALLSFVAVVIWILSAPVFPPDRTQLWSLFTGWIAVWVAASGIYSGAQLVTTGAERVRSMRRQKGDAGG